MERTDVQIGELCAITLALNEEIAEFSCFHVARPARLVHNATILGIRVMVPCDLSASAPVKLASILPQIT